MVFQMMEAILNLLWLVIACGAICLWRGVWRRRVAPSGREWLALITFLFLLFPVISLTDDLHEELALAECSTGTKHFLGGAHGTSPQDHSPRAAGTFGVVSSNRFRVTLAPQFELAILSSAQKEIPSAASVSSGRSPPLISI
jgi:hypothetical protein